MTRPDFYWRRSAAAVAAVIAAAAATAQAAAPEDATRERIREAVQRATGTAPETVEPSTLMPGYYEVRAKGAVAYVDAGAKHLVKGQVIDLATGENLTLSRLPGAPVHIDVASLPKADAITTVAGKGRRELVVFVDPNCNYCRSLEPELAKVSDVTVRRFVMPVLGPGSKAAARNVWCASDKPTAWRLAVAGQVLPAAAEKCDSAALDRNLALAKKLGISATPTIVFPNGERVVAAMPASAIDARLVTPALGVNP